MPKKHCRSGSCGGLIDSPAPFRTFPPANAPLPPDAGALVHDVRNMLQVISGFGDMLLRLNLVKDDGLPILRDILRAADRSTALTQQLLVSGHRDTLHPREAYPADLIGDAMPALTGLLGPDIRVHVDLQAPACLIHVDPDRFREALVNLATNARDAMPDGGDLTLRTRLAPPDDRPPALAGPCLTISLADSGAGMDPETLRCAFDPYFTTKPPTEGLGLGLSLVHDFMRQSGGAVTATSHPALGTTIHLHFPAVLP